MSKPQLWKVIHENKKEGYKLDCYTDAFVYDPDTDKKNPALAAIRFGGDPEKVRALSDAIYGGVSVEIDAGIEPVQLRSLTKQYRRQISHDGVYAEATLIVQDDAPAIKEREKKTAGQTALDDPPRKCYIFCRKDDTEQLFEEIDRKICVPLIPAFRDYLLTELKRRGILKQLTVLSQTVRFDAWTLRCSSGDKNIIAVVEDGLRSGAICIPDAAPETANAFDEINTVSQYLKAFGVTIAEQIKGQFSPLFDPATEPLSNAVLTVNENIRTKAGYSLYQAQLAAAEALKRKLDRHEPALLIAECGSGKSKIGVTALYASHLAAGKSKTFNVVLGPSHITKKWVREIEETIPHSFAGVIHSISELNKFYEAYEKGTGTAFAVISKEKARDGYMHAPSVHWNGRRKAFLCPDCYHPIMEELTDDGTKYEVVAEVPFFRTENSKNHKCKKCGSVLWSALTPGAQGEWVKIGGYGFAHRQFIRTALATAKDTAVIAKLTEIAANPDGYYAAAGACRRFAISTYIKKKMRGKLDGALIDELHQYNNDSGQGDAMAEIAHTADKVVGMTATLINGYASGIFHLLYRLLPGLMLLDGKIYKDPRAFCMEYGVMESTYELKAADYNANRRAVKTKKKDRLLPGVSPLVYSRFLMENAVFLSLMDMGKDLPEYEEIPIALEMRTEIRDEYDRIRHDLQEVLKHEREIANKILSAYLNLLTVYPDQPYDQPPVLHPFTGDPIVVPRDTASLEELSQKDLKTLELVDEKLARGEKVLIYTSWVRIDTQEKLLQLLAARGYRVGILSASVEPAKREMWLTEQLSGGLQVLIVNPTCVETGLDLNDFTTLIYYNIGYNLFTLRQSSRRSWRINQTAPRVEVYLFYYKNTIQNRAMELMASKLAVAGIIEGNISDEGLAAMSNCQDLTSQLAKELTLGIRSEVEDLSAMFRRMAILKPHDVTQTADVAVQSPILPQQIVRPIVLPKITQALEIDSFAFVTAVRRRKKSVPEPDEDQLSFAELLSA